MRRWYALAVFAVVAGAPVSTMAFELLRNSGNPCSADPNLRWIPAEVAVDTSDLAAQRRTLADEARDIWQRELGTRFRFTSGAGRPCDVNDGVTTIAFGDRDCQGLPFEGDILAITVTSWINDRIVDADVSFNEAVQLNDAAFRQVVMHELGHVLGLDHSDACGQSGRGTLMNSRLTESLSAPQADDLAGARFIYAGGGNGGGEVPKGANACSISDPRADRAWPLALGLALIGFGGRFFERKIRAAKR